MAKLLALHGQTLNGADMRQRLRQLDTLGIELVCPDAPHLRSVTRAATLEVRVMPGSWTYLDRRRMTSRPGTLGW